MKRAEVYAFPRAAMRKQRSPSLRPGVSVWHLPLPSLTKAPGVELIPTWPHLNSTASVKTPFQSEVTFTGTGGRTGLRPFWGHSSTRYEQREMCQSRMWTTQFSPGWNAAKPQRLGPAPPVTVTECEGWWGPLHLGSPTAFTTGQWEHKRR